MRLPVAAACLVLWTGALWTGAAAADGPALAHVTLDGRTMTLTAQNAPFQPPMIRPDGDALHLTFADLHLGFPLPPILDLSLLQDAEGWRVTGFRLETTRSIYSNDAAEITDIYDQSLGALSLTLTTEALAPTAPFGAALVPIWVEITLRSP